MKKLICLSISLIHTLAIAQTSRVIYKTTGSESVEKATDDDSYSITITVTNIRNDKGVIRFKFYDDLTPFPDAKGFLREVVSKSQLQNDSLIVTFYGFSSKNMGVALLDDENDNWEMDIGWFFPKEGHAFSDYYHTALRKPVYEDFKFLLTGDKKIVMKMKYY